MNELQEKDSKQPVCACVYVVGSIGSKKGMGVGKGSQNRLGGYGSKSLYGYG